LHYSGFQLNRKNPCSKERKEGGYQPFLEKKRKKGGGEGSSCVSPFSEGDISDGERGKKKDTRKRGGKKGERAKNHDPYRSAEVGQLATLDYWKEKRKKKEKQVFAYEEKGGKGDIYAG